MTGLAIFGGDVSRSNNSISLYIEKISQFPMLSAEDEKSLLVRFLEGGDKSAGHAVVNSHLRLVVKIAMEYRRYHAAMFDLIGEGNFGLLKALKNFSLKKNVRFSTYAMLWIRASIQEFILRTMSIVRVGTTASQKRIIFGLNKVKRYLGIIDNEQYDSRIGEVSKMLNVSERELVSFNRSSMYSVSASDAISGEGDDTIESTLEYLGENPEEACLRIECETATNDVINRAMMALTDREREVVKLRKIGKKEATLTEIAKKFNISAERVRQIEVSAMKKLKNFASKNVQI